MKLDELLKTKRIREQTVAAADILATVEKADSDLKTAQQIISQSHVWAFAIAYNAVLQAGRAYVFAGGYRPASHEGHKNTFLFLAAALPKEHELLVTFFDRMRVKRNETVYDASDAVTETEAETLLTRAEEFVEVLKNTELLRKVLKKEND